MEYTLWLVVLFMTFCLYKVIYGVFAGPILRLLHRLKLVRGVWLQDYSGRLYFSYKMPHPFGGTQAYVYPGTKIGSVILNDDGTTSGESSYIKKWTDFN